MSRTVGGSRTDERGTTSLLVVALVGVLVLLGLAASFVVATAATHRRAQSGADLAALAGATALQRGQDPCAAASRVASGNDVTLVACRVEGEVLTVEVHTDGPEFLGHAFEVVGRARAGPGAGGQAGRHTRDGPPRG